MTPQSSTATGADPMVDRRSAFERAVEGEVRRIAFECSLLLYQPKEAPVCTEPTTDYNTSAPAPSISAPQVWEQNGRLFAATSELLDVVALVEARLTPITRPEAEGGEDAMPMPTLVPLASDLHHMGDRIESATRRIRSVLDRVEL